MKLSIIIFAVLFISLEVSSQSDLSSKKTSHEKLIPARYLNLLDSLPDYYQRDKEFGGFPLKGSMYCGPVAASNALIHFINNKQLNWQLSNNKKKDQHKLICQLGSRSYINTSPTGSSPKNLCRGMNKFLFENTGTKPFIKFYGWRSIQKEFKSGSRIPDLQLAKKSLVNGKAVLFNLGWYSYNSSKDEYIRKGGHWVTFAGFSKYKNNPSREILIFHDPDTRYKKNDYIYPTKIKSGKLTGSFRELPQNARGYYSYKTFSGYGIIEGMIIIDVISNEGIISLISGNNLFNTTA